MTGKSAQERLKAWKKEHLPEWLEWYRPIAILQIKAQIFIKNLLHATQERKED